MTEQGATLKLSPGIYRESVILNKAIRLTTAKEDRGKVILMGSEPASGMKWEKCSQRTCPKIGKLSQNNTYFTSLNWSETPYLIHEIDKDGIINKLVIARSPNYVNEPDGRFSRNWWTATNKEMSENTLEDNIHLTNLSGIEGSKVYMIDGGSRCGYFLYLNNPDSFDRNRSAIEFKTPAGHSIFGLQEKGIGPYTKYYLEGKLEFLDTPGEWLYDQKDKKLYIWPLENRNPKDLNIEVSRRSFGIGIKDASNITIDGLSFRYINDDPAFTNYFRAAISINPSPNTALSNIQLNNIRVENSANGIHASGYNAKSEVNNLNIDHMYSNDTYNSPLSFVASNAAPSNIYNVSVSNSDIKNFANFSEQPGINFHKVSNVKFYKNNISNSATYGIHFGGFERDVGIVNNILVEQNIIRNVCQSFSSCAALKFWGGKYENTIARKNIITDNLGWSYCQEAKMGRGFAHGIFISNASGINLNSNIILGNSGHGIELYTRQIETKNNNIQNNLIGFSKYGINLTNPEDLIGIDYDKKAHDTRYENTVIKNNILLENKTGLGIDPASPDSVLINYNAYIGNNYDMKYKDRLLKETSDISELVGHWDKYSIDTDTGVFNNFQQRDFNISYLSMLRGRGEPKQNGLSKNYLYLYGFATDIGPCKFQWLGTSCPIMGKSVQ